MAHSVQRLTLNFGSGSDLTAHRIEPRIGLCTGRAEPAWDSLSPSLSAPPLLTLYLSLKINKLKKIKLNLKKILLIQIFYYTLICKQGV